MFLIVSSNSQIQRAFDVAQLPSSINLFSLPYVSISLWIQIKSFALFKGRWIWSLLYIDIIRKCEISKILKFLLLQDRHSMTQSKDVVPPRLEALVMSWHRTCYFNSIGYNSLFIYKYSIWYISLCVCVYIKTTITWLAWLSLRIIDHSLWRKKNK